MYACMHNVMNLPNGSQPAQLLEGLAHSPLELQSGCRVLYIHTYIHIETYKHITIKVT